MANLDNTRKDLMEGLVLLLRNEVSGWSTNDEYGIANVYTKSVPESSLDEFPRGAVDVISTEDEEISYDLSTRLRTATVQITVFSDSPSILEDLIEDSEREVRNKYEQYVGDWTVREIDNTGELSEDSEVDNMLRYNRPFSIVFETIIMD